MTKCSAFIKVFSLLLLSSTLEAQWIQTNGPLNCGNIRCLITHDNYLFAGTESGGVFLTTDKGKNWIGSNNGLLGGSITSFCIFRDDLFVVISDDAVFRSTNNGASWSKITSGELPKFGGTRLGANDSSLFAVSNGSIFRLTNIDSGWVPLTGLSAHGLYSVASNGINIIVGGDYGFWFSIDDGKNWNFTQTAPWAEVNVVVADDSGFIAFSSTGIYRSKDNGKNWSFFQMPFNFCYSYLISGNRLFAGTSNGIYMSTDKGASWNDFSANSGKTNIEAIAECDTNIFIAPFPVASVWRRPLSEFITRVQIINQSPVCFSLEQNYPNPFNPTTTIRYNIATAVHVTLKVYDILGRLISELVNEEQSPGSYSIMFSASSLPGGVYFYKLDANSFSQTKRLSLVK